MVTKYNLSKYSTDFGCDYRILPGHTDRNLIRKLIIFLRIFQILLKYFIFYFKTFLSNNSCFPFPFSMLPAPRFPLFVLHLHTSFVASQLPPHIYYVGFEEGITLDEVNLIQFANYRTLAEFFHFTFKGHTQRHLLYLM
jgi:hypothetical protein